MHSLSRSSKRIVPLDRKLLDKPPKAHGFVAIAIGIGLVNNMMNSRKARKGAKVLKFFAPLRELIGFTISLIRTGFVTL